MKLTVVANGDVVVETDDPRQAAQFVREFRNGKHVTKHVAQKRNPLEIASVDEPLSPQLVETWNWLIAHDMATGVTADAVAHALKIKLATANYRVTHLVRKDLARRVSRGHYRAGGKRQRPAKTT